MSGVTWSQDLEIVFQYSSQQKASIAGKPNPEFFKQAAKIIGVDHRKVSS